MGTLEIINEKKMGEKERQNGLQHHRNGKKASPSRENQVPEPDYSQQRLKPSMFPYPGWKLFPRSCNTQSVEADAEPNLRKHPT